MTLKTLLMAALVASTALAQGLNYPAGLQPGDEYRVLFVTDSSRDATATDISTYDAFVTADATAVPFLASLNTSWRAVGSTAAVSARDH
ncbi:MAG: PEP-CTERM sorting domain-containing protein, partial [Planctomycetes bacterium]|nr:PEP-CTERM sorting domain-containing protein [Planctomycetota bacterium]